MKQPVISKYALWLIFFISLTIPFSIIHWGISQKMLFHPDEIYFNIANVLDLIAHTEKLEFFNYPHYLFNLVFITSHILAFFNFDIDAYTIAYIGRSIVALHYAGNVVIIVKTIHLLGFNRAIIYLCALLSAFLPAFIMHSVFITDLPMTFYILLCAYFCLRSNNEKNIKYLIYASISVGFATACKFTAALSGIMVLYTLIQYKKDFHLSVFKCFKALSIYAVLSFLTFCILSPLSILHIGDLINGLLYELNHVKEGHLGQETMAHSIRYSPIIYPFTALLPFGLGPLLFFGVFGLFYLIRKQHTRAMGVFAIVWFLAFGILTFQPLRYQFPVIVISIFGFAFLLWHINTLLKKSMLRKIAGACLLIGIAGQLYYSLTFIERYRNDTRIEARNWLESTLPPNSDIMFFYDQAYNPVPTYAPLEQHHFSQATWYSHSKQGHMVIGDQKADYLVLSSINFLRDYRDNTNNLFYIHQARNNQGNWELIKRFSDRHFAKRALFFLDPFFSTYFLSPDIEIYKRSPNIYTLPKTIHFGQYGNSHLFTSRNWYRSNQNTRWMKHDGGELTLRLDEKYKHDAIAIDLKLRVYSERLPVTMDIFYLKRKLGSFSLNNQQKGTSDIIHETLIIPAQLIKNKEHITLKFHADKFTRPHDLYEKNKDNRLLSIGFKEITIRHP